VSFLFRPWFSISALLFVASAGFMIYTHRAEVHFDKNWFLATGNLGLLAVSIILLKIVHEFGHGVTCKHYGGEVHEIGFMIMILTPMFYVNTSDTWLFPNKKHRMYVSAAGVYVELIFAAALAYIWLILAPGFWKQFTFAAVVAASFTTLLFNANPLMRFDGYYIMSDWLEIPNLRQKSRAFLGRQFRKLFFGPAYPEATRSVPGRDSSTFAIYSLASFAYLLFLMSHVFRKLHLLDKFGLSLIAYVLLSLWAIAVIIWPISRFFTTPYKNAARYNIQLSTMNRFRPLFVFIGLVVAVIVILNLPFPKTVKRSCALELADAYIVRASEPGFVEEVLTKEGDTVKKGQVLARLRSPELQTKLITERETLRQIDVQLNQALAEDSALKFKVASHQREEAVADLKDTESKVTDLSLTTGLDGRVLTRNMDEKKGRYLAAGEPLCIVGPSADFDILVPLTEQEARFVKRGAPVVLKVTALPEMTFHGEITQEPLATLGNALPASLTAKRGGDVDTTIDKAGKEKPLEHQWYAQVKIVESSHLLRPGMTGRVKVKCGIQTVGRVLGQKLLDSINLNYRL
jgi:putative peptide zinc metalloprotease protein